MNFRYVYLQFREFTENFCHVSYAYISQFRIYLERYCSRGAKFFYLKIKIFVSTLVAHVAYLYRHSDVWEVVLTWTCQTFPGNWPTNLHCSVQFHASIMYLQPRSTWFGLLRQLPTETKYCNKVATTNKYFDSFYEHFWLR